MSIRDLAQVSFVSTTSIFRFVKNLIIALIMSGVLYFLFKSPVSIDITGTWSPKYGNPDVWVAIHPTYQFYEDGTCLMTTAPNSSPTSTKSCTYRVHNTGKRLFITVEDSRTENGYREILHDLEIGDNIIKIDDILYYKQ